MPKVALWWPHTHGEPNLHRVALEVRSARETVTVDAGRVGFRTLRPGGRPDQTSSLTACICTSTACPCSRAARSGRRSTRSGSRRLGTSCAGALQARARRRHEHAAHPGHDRLRVSRRSTTSATSSGSSSGRTSCSRTSTTRSMTDALPSARRARGARRRSAALAGRPEPRRSVRQQRGRAAGRDARPRPGAWQRASCSASCCRGWSRRRKRTRSTCPPRHAAATLPFRPDRGVANYFGVGGYRRPLEDARRAEVRLRRRVPRLLERPGRAGLERSCRRCKRDRRSTIPRGRRACRATPAPDWDFEDVRDHYLQLLFGVDPAELRRSTMSATSSSPAP